jgi:hypothetical protein
MREQARLPNAIGEGVSQIVRLLRVPRLFVEDVGARVNMSTIVGVALMMRRLVGGVLRLIVLRLALRLVLWLYLHRRGQFWRLKVSAIVVAVMMVRLPVEAALLWEERENTRPWESQPSHYCWMHLFSRFLA